MAIQIQNGCHLETNMTREEQPTKQKNFESFQNSFQFVHQHDGYDVRYFALTLFKYTIHLMILFQHFDHGK